jgi:hypothetical protein
MENILCQKLATQVARDPAPPEAKWRVFWNQFEQISLQRAKRRIT